MSVGSRAGGQSAVAKADYIEREGRYEQDREELEHRESGNMPEWAEKVRWTRKIGWVFKVYSPD